MGAMKDRMLRGELYVADDPALAADHARAQELLDRYNATRHGAQDERDRRRQRLARRGRDRLSRMSIGDDSVVGAGAVVTRDLPAAVVAVGDPARVIRAIDERDRVDVWQC